MARDGVRRDDPRPTVGPALAEALAATAWPEREAALGRALELVAARFADALLATVTDPALQALPRVGAVDQYVDSTGLLDRTAVAWRRRYLPGPPV